MNKSTISVVLLVLLFVSSIETFAQKQIVRRVPNEPVVPQKQAQPTKTPTHHAPKKKNSEKKKGGYEYVDGYVEELARVCLNDKWGFIDKSGTLVIPCKYDYAYSFSEGLAEVKLNGKYGFIDKMGTEVIPCKYDVIDYLKSGLASVKLNGKDGYITQTCIWYDDADKNLSDNLRRVQLNGKYGFIDKSGTEVIPCKYDEAGCFRNGIAKVTLKGKSGCITQTGIWYDDAGENLTEDSLRWVKLNGKWGCIDNSGTLIIPCKYDQVGSSSEGLVKVQLDGKYGFIDKMGAEVIPCKYDNADGFNQGKAKVALNRKWKYVTKFGVLFDDMGYSGSNVNLIRVNLDGKYGFVNKAGALVIPYN